MPSLTLRGQSLASHSFSSLRSLSHLPYPCAPVGPSLKYEALSAAPFGVMPSGASAGDVRFIAPEGIHAPRMLEIVKTSSAWLRDARLRSESIPKNTCSRFKEPGLSTCIRQHTSAYVSIRQHTSAYVSIRQHT
jgi:hypothetical protein